MIELIKERIRILLNKHNDSLFMGVDLEGRNEILWKWGRSLSEMEILHLINLCKKTLSKSNNNSFNSRLELPKVYLNWNGHKNLKNDNQTLLGNALIYPVNCKFFIYIDNGTKNLFPPPELARIDELCLLLGRILDKDQTKANTIDEFSGTSNLANKVRELVVRYAKEKEPVLLIGESGAGKTYIARLIHKLSKRRGGFVEVDMPNMPETLFENELFGHSKGAYTDARENKVGLVAEADGGSLFFDEISEIPLSVQAKLLKFVETGNYRVLGENKIRHVDVRIITSTNKDLEIAVEKKEFRQDLYFRLNCFLIEIPPLRDRKEDIHALVDEYSHFLKDKKIGHNFYEAFEKYNWPGNVRELLVILKRLKLLPYDELNGDSVRELLEKCKSSNPSIKSQRSFEQQLWHKIEAGQSFWEAVWSPFIKRDLGRNAVKLFLKEAYDRSSGSLKKMVKILNIERDYNRFVTALHKYKIHPKKED